MSTSEEYDPMTGGACKDIAEDRQWIGFEFSECVAAVQEDGSFGEPIHRTRQRILELLNSGKRVKICTPLAIFPDKFSDIQAWLHRYGFPSLEITRVIDENMVAYFSPLVTQVIPNKGTTLKEEWERTRG